MSSRDPVRQWPCPANSTRDWQAGTCSHFDRWRQTVPELDRHKPRPVETRSDSDLVRAWTESSITVSGRDSLQMWSSVEIFEKIFEILKFSKNQRLLENVQKANKTANFWKMPTSKKCQNFQKILVIFVSIAFNKFWNFFKKKFKFSKFGRHSDRQRSGIIQNESETLSGWSRVRQRSCPSLIESGTHSTRERPAETCAGRHSLAQIGRNGVQQRPGPAVT